MSVQTPRLDAVKRRYISMDEAAEILDLSRDTIRRMIRRGELEARKFGKSVRITVASLEAAGEPMQAVSVR